MSINTKVSLSMVDDHHLAIARKTVGEHDSALFYCPNCFSDGGFNVNALAKNLGGKLGMLGFTKVTRHLSSYWPLQLPFHRLEACSGREPWRLAHGASGHLIHHLLETQRSLL